MTTGTRKHYRKLDKFIKKLSTTERVTLNAYLMSGASELPENSNLDVIVHYLVDKTEQEWENLAATASVWASQQDLKFDGVEVPGVRRQLNFSINATESIDPTTVIVLSRDINNAEKLTLQEINVDSGDYIPVPVGALATLLREYADVIERRQEEINHQGGDVI